MAISRRALLALTLVLLSPLLFIAKGGGGKAEALVETPILASPNVELLTTVPGSASISGEFSPSAPFFYTSGLDSISVFDVSDPRKPTLEGKLANLVFENEAMSYGERRDATGKVVKRFVLVGVDLFQAAPNADRTDVERRVGGEQVIVVDVTDPTDPKIAGKTPGSPEQGGVTSSSHTVQCVDLACEYAYTAGSLEGFSIIDLRDLAAPKQVKTVKSPAADKNPVFANGAGHYWDIDDAGVAWNTGAGGTAAFDISDPLNPLALGATNPQGAMAPLNDFIHHNSMRPNARSFKAGATPSLANGNVAVVTEEDYANDGDEVVCQRSGTLQTWSIPDLDGATFRAGNPGMETGKGTMAPLDDIQAPDEAGGGASTPVGGFCSAHWFDYHQSGMIAQGWYQQGVRLIDVNDPKAIKQSGFFTPGASQVWDAYWVPARNADGTAKADREKTNIVYTTDLLRGIDVLEVSGLPAPVAVSRRTTTATDPFDPNAKQAAATAKAPCGSPASRFTKGSVLRSTGPRLRGKATPGAGCSVRSVAVAIGRKTGKRCRFLKANGRFGPLVSCLRTSYLPAQGTTGWRLNENVRLPRGSYVVWSRATNSAGTIEKKAKARNLLLTKVARRR